MACSTATLNNLIVMPKCGEPTTTTWERPINIGFAMNLEKKPNDYLAVVVTQCSTDWCAKDREMHPVDLLARVVEGEGIKQLLMVTRKKELQKMCEYAGLDFDADDKQPNVVTLLQAWMDIGTKKFLKKNVSCASLAIICKNLGILQNESSDRSYCVEQIIKQLNIIGLENFSKKVADENVKYILEQTSKVNQPTEQQVAKLSNSRRNLEPRRSPQDKSGGSSSSISSSKSQEIPRQKPSKTKGKSPRKDKEKDKAKRKS